MDLPVEDLRSLGVDVVRIGLCLMKVAEHSMGLWELLIDNSRSPETATPF